jgi:KipI family sensor histidine kinase inhibitor
MRARRAGDAALLVQADGVAGALAAAIGAERYDGVLDVVPGAQTVLVTTEPGRVDLDDLAARVLALPLPDAGAAAAALTEIPVVYDGPDLAEVARLTGLSAGEVVARHAAAEYRVGWLGFSPGFGYLTGLDPVLAAVPRLDEPRVRVPAGAVAIAGGLAAVYSSTSPGGWRLLGRTSAVLWDPQRDPPALFAPGMRVRFRAVDETVDETADAPRGAGSSPAAGSARPAGPRAGPVIDVVRPGALATVQDLGRPGFGHLGVPRAGAADQASLRLANRLAGNPDGAAGLELTLGRAVLRFAGPARVAVTGAPAAVTVTGPDGAGPGGPGPGGADPAGPGPAAGFEVPAGALMRVGAPAVGLRTYVAVRGGIDVPPVLGSRSADLRSGLGPPPLRAGDLLPVGAPGPPSGPPEAVTPTALPAPGQPAELRVIPGPRDDWFAAGALDLLCGGSYLVTPSSDRTGLRLDGPALPRAHGDELPSEGMVTGSLQVPPGGRPILLMADHPVTGGYPVIAVVVSADIGLAAQLRPGSQIRFVLSR